MIGERHLRLDHQSAVPICGRRFGITDKAYDQAQADDVVRSVGRSTSTRGGDMEHETACAVIGVESDAPFADMQAAYRSRAKLLHPDLATEANRAEASRAMMQLNEAWAVLNAARRRSPRHAKSVDPEASPPVSRPPDPSECSLCGSAPAIPITLRTTTGLVLFWRWHRLTAIVCHGCARALYADAQARSLARGWWGVIAPLANVINMLRNRVQLVRHENRAAGSGSRDPAVSTPLDRPALYRSHWARPLPVVATFSALLIGTFLVVGFVQDRMTQQQTGTVPGIQVEPIRGVGGCITSGLYPVTCADPSAGWKILAVSLTHVCSAPDIVIEDSTTGIYYCAGAIRH
jgi:hypothetical protein